MNSNLNRKKWLNMNLIWWIKEHRKSCNKCRRSSNINKCCKSNNSQLVVDKQMDLQSK